MGIEEEKKTGNLDRYACKLSNSSLDLCEKSLVRLNKIL